MPAAGKPGWPKCPTPEIVPPLLMSPRRVAPSWTTIPALRIVSWEIVPELMMLPPTEAPWSMMMPVWWVLMPVSFPVLVTSPVTPAPFVTWMHWSLGGLGSLLVSEATVPVSWRMEHSAAEAGVPPPINSAAADEDASNAANPSRKTLACRRIYRPRPAPGVTPGSLLPKISVEPMRQGKVAVGFPTFLVESCKNITLGNSQSDDVCGDDAFRGLTRKSIQPAGSAAIGCGGNMAPVIEHDRRL